MVLSGVNIWLILAGLGLFLFGMSQLEEALKGLTGRTFKKFLRKYTGHAIPAVLSGALTTAFLQSSSMVVLLVMSLAGAGVIGLSNGIGMIMGANLGTTATGWIVSLIGFQFSISSFVYPLIAIGGIGVVFIKQTRWNYLFRFLLGFSLIFLGLDHMKEGFKQFAENTELSFLSGKPNLLFLFFGIFLSAAIQSSSASMMIFLSSLSAGVITLEQGFYLVIGADIGTTFSAVLGMIGGNAIRKKVGWSQVAFNVFTGILGLIILHFAGSAAVSWFNDVPSTIALVSFHSAFNLVGILILLPFLKPFTRLIDKVFATDEARMTKFIAHANTEDTISAIEALESESKVFIHQAIQTNEPFFLQGQVGIPAPEQGYFELKRYEAEVVDFYMHVLGGKLEHGDVSRVNQLSVAFRNATLSAKDLKDARADFELLHNSGSDHLYRFYANLCSIQLTFYSEVKEVLDHLDQMTISDIERLDLLNEKSFKSGYEELQIVFTESRHRDIDMPTMFNLIREVNNSNEAMINALKNVKGIE
ncbi:MAG: Na/Pi cotransporter family protein [Bacteroidota bacterium]